MYILKQHKTNQIRHKSYPNRNDFLSSQFEMMRVSKTIQRLKRRHEIDAFYASLRISSANIAAQKWAQSHMLLKKSKYALNS